MTVNVIYLKNEYEYQYKRTYYRKTKPTVREMDARLNKYAYYANKKLLFTTDKYGIREIWNQLDYLLKEIE